MGEEEIVENYKLVNIFATAKEREEALFAHPALEKKEVIQEKNYAKYEKHTISKAGIEIVQEVDVDIIQTEEYYVPPATYSSALPSFFLGIFGFFRRCVCLTFVFLVELVCRTLILTFSIASNRSVWDVLLVAGFALFEAFISFIMALVTIFVSIILNVDAAYRRNDVTFSDNTRPVKEILPTERCIPPADLPARSLRVQKDVVGDAL